MVVGDGTCQSRHRAKSSHSCQPPTLAGPSALPVILSPSGSCLSSLPSDLIPLSLSSSPLGAIDVLSLSSELAALRPISSDVLLFLPRMPLRCHKISRNLSPFLQPTPLPGLPSSRDGHTVCRGPGRQGGSDSSPARHLSTAPHLCPLTVLALHPPWFGRDSRLPAGMAARPPCLSPLFASLSQPAHWPPERSL